MMVKGRARQTRVGVERGLLSTRLPCWRPMDAFSHGAAPVVALMGVDSLHGTIEKYLSRVKLGNTAEGPRCAVDVSGASVCGGGHATSERTQTSRTRVAIAHPPRVWLAR